MLIFTSEVVHVLTILFFFFSELFDCKLLRIEDLYFLGIPSAFLTQLQLSQFYFFSRD